MNNGTDDQIRNGRPGSGDGSDEHAVESLLSLASSRPEPSDADREAIRASVKKEWQTVTGKRKLKRRAGVVAIAASVLLAMTVVLLTNKETAVRTNLQEMASVEKISGRVQVLQAEAEESAVTLQQQMPVYVGQSIKTASGSGIALILEAGISLRIDELSEVRLIGENSLKLIAGRVYVDTHANGSAGSASRFEILTDMGAVRHLGTQYMVLMNASNFSVSVREGSVQVIAEELGEPSALYVRDGMALSVDSKGASNIVPNDIFGTQWQWAEQLGSGFVLDSRTIAEFLEWVARETGYEIEYESADARSVAEETVLHGTVDLPAREALDLVLATSDLSATMMDGVIEVRMKQ